MSTPERTQEILGLKERIAEEIDALKAEVVGETREALQQFLGLATQDLREYQPGETECIHDLETMVLKFIRSHDHIREIYKTAKEQIVTLFMNDETFSNLLGEKLEAHEDAHRGHCTL